MESTGSSLFPPLCCASPVSIQPTHSPGNDERLKGVRDLMHHTGLGVGHDEHVSAAVEVGELSGGEEYAILREASSSPSSSSSSSSSSFSSSSSPPHLLGILRDCIVHHLLVSQPRPCHKRDPSGRRRSLAQSAGFLPTSASCEE